jgi:hypothetical protein
MTPTSEAMHRTALLGVAAFAILSHVAEGQERLKTGAIVHAKQTDVIACMAPDVLREITEQLKNVAPPEHLQERLNKLDCSMIAADLEWKVAETHGDMVRTQLVPPGSTPMARPIMYFFITDVLLKPG